MSGYEYLNAVAGLIATVYSIVSQQDGKGRNNVDRGNRNDAYKGPRETRRNWRLFPEETESKTEMEHTLTRQRPSLVLPALCLQYWSRKGCTGETCHRLHLCKLFLGGICKFGDRCSKNHSLDSSHNEMVCAEKGVPMEPRTVCALQRRFAESGVADSGFYQKHLEICFGHTAATCFQNCNRMHICRQYVTGTCPRQPNYKFGHNLRTPHNTDVLERHRSSNITDSDVREKLQENTAVTEKRLATARERAPAATEQRRTGLPRATAWSNRTPVFLSEAAFVLFVFFLCVMTFVMQRKGLLREFAEAWREWRW